MKKLKDSRGETLVETMVSILIAVLAFSFLAMAAVTAAKLNARVRDTDLSFRYEATPANNGEITLTGRIANGSEAISLYENNGYIYYTAEGAAP